MAIPMIPRYDEEYLRQPKERDLPSPKRYGGDVIINIKTLADCEETAKETIIERAKETCRVLGFEFIDFLTIEEE
jgi:hypothetical protein